MVKYTQDTAVINQIIQIIVNECTSQTLRPGTALRGCYRQGRVSRKSESAELSLHDGTRQGGDWGGDPGSDQSEVWEEY